MLACDISSRRLAALADRLAAHQAALLTHKADVADEAAAQRIAEIAKERFGTVHGLANVAGGIAGIGEDVIDRPLDRIRSMSRRQTFRLNVDSAFLLTRAFVPAFKQAGTARSSMSRRSPPSATSITWATPPTTPPRPR